MTQSNLCALAQGAGARRNPHGGGCTGAPGAFPVLISRFYFLRPWSPPPTPFSLQAFVSCHLFILHTDPFLQELSSPASGLAVTSLPEPLSSEGCGFHETWWSRRVRLAVLSGSGSPPTPKMEPMWFCVCRRTQQACCFRFISCRLQAWAGEPRCGGREPSGGHDLLGRTLRF